MPSTTVQIPTPDGSADALIAYPYASGGRYPGVLLYPDGIGVRPVLREMAEKLAGEGYYVLVPNLFYRHGPAPVIGIPDLTRAENREPFFARLMPVISEHTTERAERDALAYLDFLSAQPQVRPGPVAVIGYCMGAGLALRTAAARPGQVAAVACFHPGPLVTDTPDSPHLLASRLSAKVYLGLAEHDEQSMPATAIAALREAFDIAGVRYDSEVYPGTVHGFTMSDTAAFNPDALQHHWEALLPLLHRSLAGRHAGRTPETN
ncbi:dienelactone hydrolase family protein [Nocardia sp. NPDC051832]|uniref:dienelactone hydrolase family protein n=1 Tax=Nocardia sp. NPDC051832 TaxID=3155673 RepID=UPI003429EEE5